MVSSAQILLDNNILTETDVFQNHMYQINNTGYEFTSSIVYNLPVKDIIAFSRKLCEFLTEDSERLLSEIDLPENERLTLLNEKDRNTLCFFHKDIVDYLGKITA